MKRPARRLVAVAAACAQLLSGVDARAALARRAAPVSALAPAVLPVLGAAPSLDLSASLLDAALPSPSILPAAVAPDVQDAAATPAARETAVLALSVAEAATPRAASIAAAEPEAPVARRASAERRLDAATKAAAPALRAAADAGAGAGALRAAGRSLEAALTGEDARGAGDVYEASSARALGSARPALQPARLRPAASREAPPAPNRRGIASFAFAATGAMSLWAGIWPVALIAAAAAAVLYAEVYLGGRLSRGLYEFLSLPRLRRDAARDLPGLMGLPDERSKDRARVEAFVGDWLAADAAGRKTLLSGAAADETLWRELVIAAFLAGGSAELEDQALTILASSPRGRLEPPSQVLARVLASRPASRFFDHARSSRRLARLLRFADPTETRTAEALGKLAAGPDGELRAAARAALGLGAAPRSAKRRAALWFSGIVAAVAFAVALVSAEQAIEYRRLQDQAGQDSLNIFYGPEAFIFADGYRDPRISAEVLPLLRDWRSLTEADAPRLARAVDILRESPDPKSDNVLEAIFRRADLLPLSPGAEHMLMRTLLERDHEGIWRYMRDAIEKREPSETETRRFLVMIEEGGKVGGERSFQNVFYFVKSAVPEVKEAAEKSVRRSLGDPARGERHARVLALLERYGNDADLILEAERLVLEPLGRPGAAMPSAEYLAKLDPVLRKVLEATAALDAWRPRVFWQVRAGDEDKRLIPPRVLRVVALLQAELEKAPDSEPLRWAARRQMNMITRDLVAEADGTLNGQKQGSAPRLSLRLREAEVTRLNGHPREDYSREHLRRFKAALAAETAPDAALAPAAAGTRREYLHRAARAVDSLLAASEKAGMREGTAAAELAAEDVNEVLEWSGLTTYEDEGDSGNGEDHGPVDHFKELLRDAGLLAPDGSFRTGYDRATIRRIQEVVQEFLDAGQGWDFNGKDRRPLEAAEIEGMLGILEHLDRVALRYFPGEGAADLLRYRTIGRLAQGLASDDGAMREGAGKALAQALDGKEGDAWLAHAETILVRNPSDPAVARWLLEYSARREAALRGTDDAGYAFSSLWSHAAQALVRAGRPDEPVDIMVRALENARRDGQEAPALAAFLRGRLNSEIKTTLEGAEAAFPALRPRLIDLGVRLPPALPVRLSWTAGQKDRTIYKQRHLDDFLTAIRAEAETARKAGPLSPAQTAALERAEARVPELLRLGVLSGMPEGRTQRDRLSERVSRILYDGYSAFKADFFAGEMRRAGFAPKGGSGTDIDILFYPSYSKEEVRRLTDHLKTILASGRGFDYDGKRPPLETLERDMLQAQVAALEALLRDYPESP